jgi:L-malate glycosyltransferase
MNEALPGPPLRIAVLGDMEGLHTRRWLAYFVERGHDMHAISFYRPRTELPGVTLHVLSERAAPSAAGEGDAEDNASLTRRRLPPGLLRFVHALRYRRAGLGRVVSEIAPDIFHAHYAVEHGFYGALTGYRPYIISAWGSDLLVESYKLLGRRIATWALRRADLVTANDASLYRRAIALGVPPERAAVVHLGIDRLFLEAGQRSMNLAAASGAAPLVISDRALEPLYNIDMVLRAFAGLHQRLPAARLVLAGDGSERGRLEALAQDLALGEVVQFLGRLDAQTLAVKLAEAQVYVSVPTSDSLALSNLEAMAAGAFPVVSDLPSMDGWITHGVNGLRVAPRDQTSLSNALFEALTNETLRRSAVEPNRSRVEHEGLRERNMLLMERHYYRLAGHPMVAEGEAI